MIKYRCLVVAFVLVVYTINAKGQSAKETFASRLYFPFDVGYLNSPGNNLKSGMITKLGVEYRLHTTHGLYFRLNLDDRSNSYKKEEIKGTNITKGKIKFDDYLGGIGYRIRGDHKLREFFLLQGGVSSCSYQDVESSGSNYIIKDRNKLVPLIKLTAGLEYYIVKSAAITLEGGYIWQLDNTPFGRSHMNEGALGISIGLTTSLF